ncbi:histidine triad nucleotide-binding protein [Arcobacter sp. 31_11_sub10_T18]|nr:histidine triad nucleotide-binding protein [Arcobacter sp. 31_11_sub10_T18]
MCIFCKIVNGEIPNNTVLENDEFIAFEDIHPQSKIHTIVIPKVHVESFAQVSAETMSNITPFIQEVTKKLNVDKDGYRLITNIGSNGGQEVPHLHFHILAGQRVGRLVSK